MSLTIVWGYGPPRSGRRLQCSRPSGSRALHAAWARAAPGVTERHLPMPGSCSTAFKSLKPDGDEVEAVLPSLLHAGRPVVQPGSDTVVAHAGPYSGQRGVQTDEAEETRVNDQSQTLLPDVRAPASCALPEVPALRILAEPGIAVGVKDIVQKKELGNEFLETEPPGHGIKKDEKEKFKRPEFGTGINEKGLQQQVVAGTGPSLEVYENAKTTTVSKEKMQDEAIRFLEFLQQQPSSLRCFSLAGTWRAGSGSWMHGAWA